MARLRLSEWILIGVSWLACAEAQALSAVDRSDLVYTAEGRQRSIVVYEPREPGPKPLVIFVPGTKAPSVTNSVLADTYLWALSARGFVVAAVDYNNGLAARLNCSALDRKVRNIFDRSNPRSAINAIYASTSAEPSLGMGVVGFSQGSWIAHQAGRYSADVQVKAALLMATGTLVKFNRAALTIPLTCNERQANGVPKVLAVTGEDDSVYTYADPTISRQEQLRPQLAQVTGKSCDGLSCVDPTDGSGWLLVPGDQLTDGEADHKFEMLDGGSNADPAWFLSDEPWGLNATISWLDAALRGP